MQSKKIIKEKTKKLNIYDYPGFSQDSNYIALNREYRKNLEFNAEDDPELQGLLMSMSADDILFFFNTFLFTYNPRETVTHIPFVTFPFQDDYIIKVRDAIENGEDVFTDKSRDMGVTWVILGIFLWGWRFHGWELRIGSRTRDYVDKGGDMNSLFEKVRYMIERLPDWMLPYGFNKKRGTDYNSMLKLVNPEGGKNAMVGEATGPNFGRGGRSKAIFYDEFAVWNSAEEAWTAGADTTNCRIVVGTPMGKGNKFADIKFDEQLDIHKFSLHWKLHPFKDEAWYKEECSRRTPEEVAQELDISYESSTSGRVYDNFNEVPLGEGPEFEYDHKKPLYVVWDFAEGGKDPVAILWIQVADDGTIIIVDCFQEEHYDINYFGTLISGELDSKYNYTAKALEGLERRKHWKKGVHIGDPYSGNKTIPVLGTTIKKELEKHGIYMVLQVNENTVKGRIAKAQILFQRTRINLRCKEAIDAFQNSRWPSRDSQSNMTTAIKKPVHNKYSHFRTAFEYFADWLDTSSTSKRKKKRFYKQTSKFSGYKDSYKYLKR